MLPYSPQAAVLKGAQDAVVSVARAYAWPLVPLVLLEFGGHLGRICSRAESYLHVDGIRFLLPDFLTVSLIACFVPYAWILPLTTSAAVYVVWSSLPVRPEAAHLLVVIPFALFVWIDWQCGHPPQWFTVVCFAGALNLSYASVRFGPTIHRWVERYVSGC